MAFLTPYTRAQFVQYMATEYASAATIPADTSEGSSLGSIFGAKALVAQALFQQIYYVNQIARLASIPANPNDPTLPNPDVDSFVNAFGVYREQANPSTGQVVFSTSSQPSQPILIPAVAAGSPGGVIAQTPSGIQFQVIIDPNNSNYNAALQGYVIAAGTTSVSCTVQCTSNGTIGNVAANQITIPYSGPGVTSIAGIAGTNNPAAFTNASSVESDTALKARFPLAMSTGTVSTANAIGYAVASVQIGLTYSVGDNLNSSGVSTPGVFTVVVNNSGTATAPSSALLTAVQNAVDQVRTLGISRYVIAPTLIPVNLTANIKIAPGYVQSAVIAACTAAYTALINNIGLDPLGNPTSAKIAAVYATLYTTPGVADVTSLTLNGGTVDVAAAFAQQCVVGTIALSPY